MGPNPHPTLQVDHRQRLYLERFAGSVEAVSFDDVRDTSNALAGLLRKPAMAIGEQCSGEIEEFRRYKTLLRLASSSGITAETWFHPRTPTAVRSALEAARLSRRRVRLFFGDVASGIDSLVLCDTTGFIGRRGEVLQYPVLMPRADCSHGLRVLDNALVRIQYVDDHYDLWCHRRYRLPTMDFVPLADGRARLLIEDGREIDFDDVALMLQFKRYVAGERFTEPPCLRGAATTSPAPL